MKHTITITLVLVSMAWKLCYATTPQPVDAIKFPIHLSYKTNTLTYPKEWQNYTLDEGLFTDFASKDRAFYIPATSMAIRLDGSFEFPVGSAISKTFYYGDNFQKIVETRILYKSESGWNPVVYRWTPDRKPVLAKADSEEHLTLDTTNKEITYTIPSINQCKQCHYKAYEGLSPIGLNAIQANVTLPWLRDSIRRWNDENNENLINQSSLARRYLHANCAHCHNRDGLAGNTGLYLDIFNSNPQSLGVCKRPVSAGLSGISSLVWNIVPGDSENSLLLERIKTQNPSLKMPEIGRNMPDPRGIALIKQWIDLMPKENCDQVDVNIW